MSAAVEAGERPGRAPLNLRRGTMDDVLALIEVGRDMHRESHYGSFSEIRVQQVIEEVLLRGMCLISEAPDGRIAGTMGLSPVQAWWSEDWQVEDRWLFVRPEYRREGHARALLEAAVRAARDIKLPLLVAHIGSRARGKMRLLQRTLGEPVGAVFFLPPG